MSLPSLAVNTVTLRRKTWTLDAGVRVASVAEAAATASIQPMSEDRKAVHEIPRGVAGYTAYFATDPNLAVDDEIAWGATTLACVGPALNQAGRGVVWAVPCVARS